MSALKSLSYVGLALLIGGAVWWLVATVRRADEAAALQRKVTQLEATLTAERAFAAAVDDLTRRVDERMAGVLNAANANARQTRDAILKQVPAGSTCFSAATVSLLNGAAHGGTRRVPAPAGIPQPVKPSTTASSVP